MNLHCKLCEKKFAANCLNKIPAFNELFSTYNLVDKNGSIQQSIERWNRIRNITASSSVIAFNCISCMYENAVDQKHIDKLKSELAVWELKYNALDKTLSGKIDEIFAIQLDRKLNEDEKCENNKNVNTDLPHNEFVNTKPRRALPKNNNNDNIEQNQQDS